MEMAETEVTKREGQGVQTTLSPETETTYIPDVDIQEDSECIHLVADMPGVDQKSVAVTVENNVLTVEGNAKVEAPEGYKLVGQEYGVGKYRRDFTLSNAVDTDGIKARVTHGVLEVTIPKREEVKTRKIEIGS
jgi:HSP20 family molecular chaperone IbpA